MYLTLCPIKGQRCNGVRKPIQAWHTRSTWSNPWGGEGTLLDLLQPSGTGCLPLQDKVYRQSGQQQGSPLLGQAHQGGGSSLWGVTRRVESPVLINVTVYCIDEKYTNINLQIWVVLWTCNIKILYYIIVWITGITLKPKFPYHTRKWHVFSNWQNCIIFVKKVYDY